MDYKRAREIASSRNMVNVTYNGSSIYIENVNSDTATATIHALNEPNVSQQVSISNLMEQ